tara:strand:+ start:5879 stop:6895 length:1017 start_codon:yes stop_codon:yes gene_type:complete
MKQLSGLVEREVYSDEPHFSDELLLPALATGHHVTLVTAFLPSYLVRLVSDLASSPEIEPGKLTVIFCVPFKPNEVVGEARLFAEYLTSHAESAAEVKDFLNDSAELAREGGLRLSALLSTQNLLLTPSCIGIIESGQSGSSEVLSFLDATAGDKNSPIPVRGSWGNEADQLDKALSIVSRALNGSFPNLLRRSHDEVMSSVREIREKGYLRLAVSRDKEGQSASPAKTPTSPARTRNSKVSIESAESSPDVELDDDSFEIERILREVFLREAGLFGDDVTIFLGEPSLDWGTGFEPEDRNHTPPLSNDLVEVVGHGFASCWCGESFDREQGCPERYY